MRYLLDANAVIALLNDSTSPIARRIGGRAARLRRVCSGNPRTVYGAFKSQRVEKNVARVDGLQFPVLEFDQEDARQAGEIRAHLASKGTPIGPYDLLIAGQAKARKLTLVTHNTTEFQRVPSLKVEDWKGATPRRPRDSDRVQVTASPSTPPFSEPCPVATGGELREQQLRHAVADVKQDEAPTLGGAPVTGSVAAGLPVYASSVGCVHGWTSARCRPVRRPRERACRWCRCPAPSLRRTRFWRGSTRSPAR